MGMEDVLGILVELGFGVAGMMAMEVSVEGDGCCCAWLGTIFKDVETGQNGFVSGFLLAICASKVWQYPR